MRQQRLLFTVRRCYPYSYFFFFNDTATTEIYTLSLHDALPIFVGVSNDVVDKALKKTDFEPARTSRDYPDAPHTHIELPKRSEEHTSELQSQSNLVCRLLLEKKKRH